MIAYATIGVTDFPRAAKFYQALADAIGAQHLMGSLQQEFLAWVGPNGEPGIGIMHPFDGKLATVGNGMMIALAAKDEDQVKDLYRIALENGGRCEGAPGPRNEEQYYAAYFHDPDGNKVNAFFARPR